MQSLEDIFDKQIPEIWKDYEPRPSQKQMSKSILEVIVHENHALIEAGTGVGKSLAYLLPSVLHSLESGKTVVISTETKALQDQLIQKDIPLVEEVLGRSIDAKLAMGASNYLCKRKWEQMDEQGNIPVDLLHQLDHFQEWTSSTITGLRNDYNGNLNLDTWSKLGREVDNCFGRACKNYSTSFYFKARESWKNANILIANHALLAFHITGGFHLLPEFDVLVVDEAHNFPEIVGKSMRSLVNYENSIKLLNMIHTKDNKTTLLQRLGYPAELVKLAEEAKEDLLQLFGRIPEEISFQMSGRERIQKALKLDEGKLESSLNKLSEAFFQKQDKYSKDSEIQEEKEIAQGLEMAIGRLTALSDFFHELRKRKDPNLVFWTEPPDAKKNERFLTLCSEPMNVEEIIQAVLAPKLKTIIYTSATLTPQASNFKYFQSQLGYNPPVSKQFPSPFRYPEQSLLYIPSGVPDPNDYPKNYHEVLIREIERLIQLSQGNCFVLFTSIKSMNQVKKALEHTLPFPIFSQSDWGAYGAKENFLKTKNSVLFGVNSFWQGVDVKGEKLSNVIITKLPFQVPTEPVLLTRTEKMKRENKDPFREFQLPRACILLKQGFGRLIRSYQDFGVVSILDPRIITKRYGKDFLNVFPPGIKILNNFEELVVSFQNLPKINI